MDWKGKHINTYGEIMKAAVDCETREEAQELMADYRKVTEHADVNIGYMTGYYDSETATRVMDWCDVSHPIFGKRVNVPPEEAIAKGIELGEAVRKS